MLPGAAHCRAPGMNCGNELERLMRDQHQRAFDGRRDDRIRTWDPLMR
jgi:hypothetical protein